MAVAQKFRLLYYENRGEQILDMKDNPEITGRILDAIKQAALDVDQQDKLERIVRNFAGHYSDLWTSSKAMFVYLNKVTCIPAF